MSALNRWLNGIGYLLLIAVNAWAAIMPFGGQTTGEISDKYPTLITPSGYAFSIWSLIYILLLLFVVYSFTRRGRQSPVAKAVGYYFLATCVFNMAWLIVWQLELLEISVFVMLCLLLTLIMVYRRLHNSTKMLPTGKERYMVILPFSLYIGWICVAFIVNVGALLTARNWDGFGLEDKTWAIIMLVVATVIALALGIRYKDAVVMLVFVWAFTAISIEQQAYPAISLNGYVYAAALFIIAVSIGIKYRSAYRWRLAK